MIKLNLVLFMLGIVRWKIGRIRVKNYHHNNILKYNITMTVIVSIFFIVFYMTAGLNLSV